jgi:hypothetical protein
MRQIYFFKPYDARGLGYAYNRHCELVPSGDDWICLMDLDIMFFSSQRLGEHLEEVINRHPQFSVFTCVTNRAFKESAQQLAGIRDERNLVKLKQYADQQLWKGRGLVKELDTALNGHFLLFPKWLWKKIPFSIAGSSNRDLGHHILGIDTDFKTRVTAAGYKIGVIHSLMAVHFYRMDDSMELTAHLPPRK